MAGKRGERARKSPGQSAYQARRKIEAKCWRAQAVELRVGGMSIRAIAAKLKMSPSAVHAGIEEEIAAIPAEAVERLRAVRGEQLEQVIQGCLRKAKRGDASAARACTDAINAFNKLYGLNAKVTIDLGGGLDLNVNPHEQLLARLAGLVAGAGADEVDFEPEPEGGSGPPL